MLMVAVPVLSGVKVQLALPPFSLAVEPSTVTVEPSSPIACVICAVCCKAINWVSDVFMLICCSTWANWTSCWVNWLLSRGSSGFWFCSCVVSSWRNCWKLLAICWFATLVVPLGPGVAAAAAADAAAVMAMCSTPYTRMSTPPPIPSQRP